MLRKSYFAYYIIYIKMTRTNRLVYPKNNSPKNYKSSCCVMWTHIIGWCMWTIPLVELGRAVWTTRYWPELHMTPSRVSRLVSACLLW